MKKLLLTSLFIMGATAFATNQATTPVNSLGIPISLVGTVKVPTQDDLVVEIKNANSTNNGSFMFDIGDQIPGTTLTGRKYEASFSIKRAKNGDIIPTLSTGDKGKYVIGLLQTTKLQEVINKGANVSDKDVSPTQTVDLKTYSYNADGSRKDETQAHVHITYSIHGGQATSGNKTANGTLEANVVVDSQAVAGAFRDDKNISFFVYAGPSK